MKTIKALWLNLTQPHPSLTSSVDRIRSQTLASVLALMFIIAVLVEVTSIILEPINISHLATEIPIIFIIGILIIPSRQRNYQVVALSLSLMIMVGCFVLAIMNAYQAPLVFMALGYLIAATALSSKWALAIGLLNILLTLSTPLFVPQWTSISDIIVELTYSVIATVIVYTLTFIKRYYIAINEEKSQQLAQANALLHEKIKRLEESQDLQVETENNFSKIFHSSPDPIVINRFDDGKYITYNQSFLDVMGYTDDDLHRLSGRDLFANDANAKRYLKQLQHEKKIFSTEFDVKTKSGKILTTLLSAELIDWHGEKCIVCMARDITSHKEAQQHKLNIMKEQERSHLLQQFVSNASHDFRTPLATISTSTHILRRTEDEQRRQYHLNTIERQVFRINSLVDSLTMMYMLDNRSIKFQFRSFPINQLITDIIKDHPNPDNIAITIDMMPNLPPIQVDDYYLKIAIKQLLDNAIRFTPTDGLITISTSLTEDDDSLMIRVKDTGAGMDTETLKNSFNRLYRGDMSRNQDTGGAGLGLSITHKIVEEHQGQLLADSQLGKGSCFTIVLPYQDRKSLSYTTD